MKKIFSAWCLTVLLAGLLPLNSQKAIAQSMPASYDLVVVGGTPAGIMAAIAAARMGKRSLILERSSHAGGLVANGLGATDIITRGATAGLFLEFVNRVKAYYVKTYGPQSKQVKDCSQGYHFEPSVGEKVLLEMLAASPQVTVLSNRQFDALPENLLIENNSIKRITVTNRKDQKKENYTGLSFIDATYEGDLIAAAGVPYSLGREGKHEYNEPYAGQVYKLWLADRQEEGSSNLADNAVQAYNFRLCLTTDPANRVAISKPANYNREEYLSLIEDVLSGRHSGIEWAEMSSSLKDSNAALRAQGKAPVGKWMPEGMQRLVNKVILPNSKTDANNQHRALISTDLPEENWPWPTAGWEWRDQFAIRLRNYILGLLYFGQHDEALPAWFRNDCLQWGLAADEFTDNGHFPRQAYVREGRRMKGLYLFKAADALPLTKDARPRVHGSSITGSHYDIDSHATRKREKGKNVLDGFLSYPTMPYTVPYEVMVPPVITNLLAPVPASTTHLGFATLRMEPCWMALGQAAGIAAVTSSISGKPVQKISVRAVQEELIKQGAVLIFYKDVKPDHPAFRAIQFLGLKGWLPEWTVRPDEKVIAVELQQWQKLAGIQFPRTIQPHQSTRSEAIQWLYSKIQQ
jgi:hypothetical protein